MYYVIDLANKTLLCRVVEQPRSPPSVDLRSVTGTVSATKTLLYTAVEQARSPPSEDLRSVTGTVSEELRIPKNYDLGEDYRSRPPVHLDWIITTDPSTPRVAKKAPEVSKHEGIPASEWILDTREASLEYEEYEKPRPAPPVIMTSRPKMDLEWILSTSPTEAAMMKLVEPGDRTRRVPTSEWIFRTDPDFFSAEWYDEEMYTLEDIEDEISQLDDDLLRTALMSDGSLATAHLMSDRVSLARTPNDFEEIQVRPTSGAA
ncbi:hypothetical protein Y032_0116g610 [Ancylostoma ceylanicum]|uniref:Uncharacterized protein n=1 Tax=Ancylostoma ceylanicum TaxID=53326 RepID=A0A016TCK6_9BILA|nr:hypothetical protein Y032_0116g610 [Ancylostoma ceylanicum]